MALWRGGATVNIQVMEAQSGKSAIEKNDEVGVTVRSPTISITVTPMKRHVTPK
jgi:hypothetical protein